MKCLLAQIAIIFSVGLLSQISFANEFVGVWKIEKMVCYSGSNKKTIPCRMLRYPNRIIITLSPDKKKVTLLGGHFSPTQLSEKMELFNYSFNTDHAGGRTSGLKLDPEGIHFVYKKIDSYKDGPGFWVYDTTSINVEKIKTDKFRLNYSFDSTEYEDFGFIYELSKLKDSIPLEDPQKNCQRVAESGAVFKCVATHPQLGEAVKDPSGLIWGSLAQNGSGYLYMKLSEAKEYCKSIGARLPTLNDFHKFTSILGLVEKSEKDYETYKPFIRGTQQPILHDLLINTEYGDCFLSSSPNPKYPNAALRLCGARGWWQSVSATYPQPVRCVVGPL